MRSKDNSTSRDNISERFPDGVFELLESLQGNDSMKSLHDFLHDAAVASRSLLSRPREHTERRFRAIALLVESRHPSTAVRARRVLDSWDIIPLPAVRDAEVDVERRVRFQVSHFAVEFVGNRQLSEWQFVARVYENSRATRGFILKAGARKLVPGRGGCFFWSSEHPPRSLKLLSPDLLIDLGRLKW